MVSLFQLADPSENRGDAVTVKEVLDRGAEAISAGKGSDSLEREPRVRAELLTAMGQAYSGLGLYKASEQLLKQAQVDEQVAAVPDESRVRTLVALGSTLYLAGQYDEAAGVLQSAVDLARKRLRSSSTLRSTALNSLAEVFVQLGKYKVAEDLCLEALVADRRRGREEAPVLAQTLNSLAEAYFFSGDLASAEKPMREALALREQAFGNRHALTAQSLNALGVLLYQSGRYDEALSAYQQALPTYEAVYGHEHRETATIINNVGRLDLMLGNVDAAEPLLREALALTEKFEGATHDDLVSPLNSLAMIDAYRGRLDAARTEIERAASIARLPDHGELLDQVLLNEADIELATGNRERATTLLSESKALLEKAHPMEPPEAWRYAIWDAVDATSPRRRRQFGGKKQTSRRAEDNRQAIWRRRILQSACEAPRAGNLASGDAELRLRRACGAFGKGFDIFDEFIRVQLTRNRASISVSADTKIHGNARMGKRQLFVLAAISSTAFLGFTLPATAARSIRADNPGSPGCQLNNWINPQSVSTSPFNPGGLTFGANGTDTVVVCTASSDNSTDDTDINSIFVTNTNGGGPTYPLATNEAYAAPQGNSSYLATGGNLYQFVSNGSGTNNQSSGYMDAEVVVWNLRNGDTEIELDNWCTVGTSGASFTWGKGTYSGGCNSSTNDLLFNSAGSLIGYVNDSSSNLSLQLSASLPSGWQTSAQTTSAPELDINSEVAALILLVGGLAVAGGGSKDRKPMSPQALKS